MFKRDQSEVKFGGFTFYSYYHSKNTRDICHDVKQTEDLIKRNEAIGKMADYLAGHLKNVDGKIYLVPAPQHTGNAEYTLEIAKKMKQSTSS